MVYMRSEVQTSLPLLYSKKRNTHTHTRKVSTRKQNNHYLLST